MHTAETSWASPEVDDVVEVDGLRGVIRAVHPDGHLRVASKGNHDEGVWIKPTTVKVVYREGATPLDRQKSRPARRSRPRQHSAPVQTLRVDRAVMATALRLARGDASRLQVNRDGSVYVK